MAPARGSWIICSLCNLFFRSKVWSVILDCRAFFHLSPLTVCSKPSCLCSPPVWASSLRPCSSCLNLKAEARVIPLHYNSDHSSPVPRALCGFPLQSPEKARDSGILQGLHDQTPSFLLDTTFSSTSPAGFPAGPCIFLPQAHGSYWLLPTFAVLLFL